MENKEEVTLQDCKDTIAKKHGYPTWTEFVQKNLIRFSWTEADDEAAELYAARKTVAFLKEIEELKAVIRIHEKFEWNHEIEELKEKIKHNAEGWQNAVAEKNTWKDKLTHVQEICNHDYQRIESVVPYIGCKKCFYKPKISGNK